MLIYLLIYIPFILCAYYDFVKTTDKKKNQILWLWVIVFTLFRGLRWEIGTDWKQFHDVYYHSSWDNIFTYYRAEFGGRLMDYGYMFINAVFHESGFSYTIFLLVTNFWIMWCYKDFSQRHTKYPIMTMVLLMNVGVPFPVRQTIALATSLWGFRFAVEKKWVKYAIVAMAAALIHKGSLIGIIVVVIPYILNKWKIKWWWYALAYASTFIIAEVLGDYIRMFTMFVSETDSQLQVYSDSYLNMESTSVDFGDFNLSLFYGLSYVLFFVLLLFIRERYDTTCNKRIKAFEVFFFMYAVSAIVDNIIRQSDKNGMTEILMRVTSTIDMFPLVFPLIFVVLMPRFGNGKKIPFLLFSLYMAYKFWQQIPDSFYNYVFIPYKSVFDI